MLALYKPIILYAWLHKPDLYRLAATAAYQVRRSTEQQLQLCIGHHN